MKTFTYSICILLIAGSLAGCEDMGSMAPEQCFDTLDCEPGDVCDPITEECKAVEPPPAIVDFELIPIRGDGTAETQIPEKDLASLLNISDVELELATAVRVWGMVYSLKSETSAPRFLLKSSTAIRIAAPPTL